MWDNWMLLQLEEDPKLSASEFSIYSKKRRIDVTDEV